MVQFFDFHVVFRIHGNDWNRVLTFRDHRTSNLILSICDISVGGIRDGDVVSGITRTRKRLDDFGK